jgi:hypothetical protein
MTAIPGPRPSRISPLGLTFLVVTSIGWGVNFPIMKYLLSEWPPLSSRGLTGIVGAAALALIAMLQRQSLAVPRKMRLPTSAGIAAGDYLMGCIHGFSSAVARRPRGRGAGDLGSRLGSASGVAGSRRAAIAGSRARRCARRRDSGVAGAVTKRESGASKCAALNPRWIEDQVLRAGIPLAVIAEIGS